MSDPLEDSFVNQLINGTKNHKFRWRESVEDTDYFLDLGYAKFHVIRPVESYQLHIFQHDKRLERIEPLEDEDLHFKLKELFVLARRSAKQTNKSLEAVLSQLANEK